MSEVCNVLESKTETNPEIQNQSKTVENGPKNKRYKLIPRFKPGQSGNPAGRPKTHDFRAALLRYLRARPPGKRDSRMLLLIARLYNEDPKTYLAYCYGKPVETVELSGVDGKPLFDPEVMALARKIALGAVIDVEPMKQIGDAVLQTQPTHANENEQDRDNVHPVDAGGQGNIPTGS